MSKSFEPTEHLSYKTLEDGQLQVSPGSDTTSQYCRFRTIGNLLILSALCALSIHLITRQEVILSGDVTKNVPKKLWTSWAMYSPYFAVDEYEVAPKHCHVTQVNILQRHGARYPTSGASQQITTAVEKLTSIRQYTNPNLNFLRHYTNVLGTDSLVPFGASQSHASGREAYKRYKSLVSCQQVPFVRASDSERVIHSATNWTAGFTHASHHAYTVPLSVIIPETQKSNNTLHNNMCPNAGNADAQTSAWLLAYGPPIADRLNEQAPGANITATDVYGLMIMCSFESVFYNRQSHFCNLFTQAEFGQHEYYGDLDKYYRSYGQALGPVQGVGYVNELIARLTGEAVNDNTQTNRTLDASPETFPLDRTIYADFTHDNQMVAIYSALGLFRQSPPPNPMSPEPKRNWLASHLVPFSARMVTEKLTCSSDGKDNEYVRIFVNDARQPLEFCGAGRDGLCSLDAFVESQSYARNNGDGDFEKCFV